MFNNNVFINTFVCFCKRDHFARVLLSTTFISQFTIYVFQCDVKFFYGLVSESTSFCLFIVYPVFQKNESGENS